MISNRAGHWLAGTMLCCASVTAQATSVTFTPMDDLSIMSSRLNAVQDNRHMAVSNAGEVMAINGAEQVIVWTPETTHVLGNHDCDNGSTGEPTNLMHISANGSQAMWRCRDNGAPRISLRGEDGYATTGIRIGAQTITGPNLDLHISAKDGKVFKLAPHRTSYPNQGQPRVALQVGSTTSYVQQYFDAPELDHGDVKGFSANGLYAAVAAGSEQYIVNLSDQTIQPVDAQFGTVYFVSNDGKSIIGTTGFCYWVCGTQAQRWHVEEGLTPLSPATSGTWQGVQDMSANAQAAIFYEYRMGPDFTSTEEAYIWTSLSGSSPFEDFILTHGADLAGWSDLKPLGMSQDGLYVAGVGTNAAGETGKGFLVKIDPTGQCEIQY